MAYDPLAWHDFFVMLGGASAALAGLVFVGLSIHARAVASDPLHRIRARNLTAGIVSVTIVSALVLTPGQGLTALGVELIAGGAFHCCVLRSGGMGITGPRQRPVATSTGPRG